MSSKYGSKPAGASGAVKKSAYAKLLDVRTVQTKNGEARKLVLGEGVEILLDGKKVDMGEYNSAFLQDVDSMVARLEKLADDGKLGIDFVESQKEYLAKKNILSVLEIKRP
jgi:hypothetical protein